MAREQQQEAMAAAGVRPPHPVPRALQAAGGAGPRRHLRLHAEERRQAPAGARGPVRPGPDRGPAAAGGGRAAGRRRVDGRRAAGEGRAPQGRLRRPRRVIRGLPRRSLRRRPGAGGVREEAGLGRARLRAPLALPHRGGTPGESLKCVGVEFLHYLKE